MKALMRRGVRLAVMTLGFAAVIVAVNAVPAAATPATTPGFASTELGRGTYQSKGSLRFEKGLDVVVSKITITPGADSGWHSHPGGAIGIVQQGQITLSRARGNHCSSTIYTQDQSVIERPGEVVIAKNSGSGEAVLYVTFPSVPVDGPARIDQPLPTCTGSDDQGDQGNQGD
jgi:quercetin dioxygenase-like cupin family protein